MKTVATHNFLDARRAPADPGVECLPRRAPFTRWRGWRLGGARWAWWPARTKGAGPASQAPFPLGVAVDELHQLLPTLQWMNHELMQLNQLLQQQAGAARAVDAVIAAARLRARQGDEPKLGN